MGNDVNFNTPDRSGRLLLLGVFALSFSWIPIIAISSAIILFVKAFRTFERSESKGVIASAVALGIVSLLLGLGSSVAGARLAIKLENQKSIRLVHEQIDRLETEIRSPEDAREIARQWASIDISQCPEDYQDAYRAVVALFFDMADQVEKVKNPWVYLRVFLESLASAMSKNWKATPDLVEKDQALQTRMNLVITEFSLVCAKYGIFIIGPGKGILTEP